jgi:hypothetical protein
MVKDLLSLVIEAPLEDEVASRETRVPRKLNRVFESEALSTPVRAKGLLLPYAQERLQANYRVRRRQAVGATISIIFCSVLVL